MLSREEYIDQKFVFPAEVGSENGELTQNAFDKWAASIGRSELRRDEVDEHGNRIKDRHNLGRIFAPEDRVTLRQAWEDVGGRRVGVITDTAKSLLGNGQVVDLKNKLWIYPTLDGQEWNEHIPLSDVSKHKYEIINPNSIVDVLDTGFASIQDRVGEMSVSAIGFTGNLRTCIIQFHRNDTMIGRIGDHVSRNLSIMIPILGSVVMSTIDERIWCTNMLPSVLHGHVFRVTHLKGANEVIGEELPIAMNEINYLSADQEALYEALMQHETRDGDVDYLLDAVYPYVTLPRRENAEAMTNREKAAAHRIQKSNEHISEMRLMAKVGYQQAVEQNQQDTLWELAQCNYAANHSKTKGLEAPVLDMYDGKGWRRKEVQAILMTCANMALNRGATLPRRIQDRIRFSLN